MWGGGVLGAMDMGKKKGDTHTHTHKHKTDTQKHDNTPTKQCTD